MADTTGTSATRARKASTAGLLGVVLAIVAFLGLAAVPATALAKDLTVGVSDLVAQSEGIDATPIKVDESKEVTVDGDDEAVWLSFTPTENGSYQFVSGYPAALGDEDDPEEDCGDPIARLYVLDSSGNMDEVAYNDDGAGDLQFIVGGINLKKGTTYYLECKNYRIYSRYKVSLSELDVYDISKMDPSVGRSEFYEGETVTVDALDVLLEGWDRSEQGSTIYLDVTKVATVSGWEKYNDEKGGFETCSGDPKAVGSYRVTFTGKSPYHGKQEIGFEIKDKGFIGDFQVSYDDVVWLPEEANKTYTTDELVKNELGLVVHRDFGAGEVILEYGKHYKVEWVEETEAYDEDQDEWVWERNVADTPTEPGYYTLSIVGISENGYVGYKDKEVQLRDRYDLSSCNYEMEREVPYDGTAIDAAELKVVFYKADSENEQLSTEFYEVDNDSWYDYDTDEELSGPPTEPGYYRVTYNGKGKYTGSKDLYFDIIDYSLIYNCDVSRSYTVWADGKPVDASRLNLSVREPEKAGGKLLQEDTQYSIAWLDEDGESVPAPTNPGYYRVQIQGVGSYSGSTTRSFVIKDPKSLKNCYYTGSSTFWANGKAVSADDLSVGLRTYANGDETVLTLGSDFTVGGWLDSHGKPIDAPSAPGNYAMLLKGEGSYTEEQQIEFDILDSSSLSTVECGWVKVWANGQPVKFDDLGIIVEQYVNGNYKVLKPGIDYEFNSWWRSDHLCKLDAAPSAPGSYFAKLVGKGAYTGQTYASFEIGDPLDLASHVYTVTKSVWANGEAVSLVRLGLTAERADTGAKLTYNKDYVDNSWWDEDDRIFTAAPTEAGSYYVKLAGKGEYTGTEYVRFDIKDTYDLYSYEADYKHYVAYDGKPLSLDKLGLTMSAEAEDGTKMSLKADTDYAVSEWSLYREEYDDDQSWVDDANASGTDISEIVKIGVYEIVLKGAGKYSGSKIINVEVVDPKQLYYASISGVSTPCYIENVSSIAPEVTAVDGTKLTNGVDYACSIQAWSNASNAYVDVNSIVELGEHRVLVTALGSYKGSKAFYFDVVKNPNNSYDIAKATITVANKTYTGSAQKPAPTVKLNSMTLKAGTDYTVAYKNNTKAGTATVTVTGAGVYSGSQSKTFKISAASITKASFGTVKARTYTGKAQKPSVTVKFGGKALKSGTDYTVKYAKNTNVGTATMTITGKGNFGGTKKITFKINKAKIGKAGFSKVKAQKLKKKGQAVKPKVTVKFNKKTLKVKKDYTITYKNNKKKGTASIVIKGKGNFSGSKTIKFKIK